MTLVPSVTPVRDRADIMRHITVAILCSIFIVSPLVYMAMDREPPYVFLDVDIWPKEQHQGEDIYINFHVSFNERLFECNPGWVYREFKDSAGKVHVFDPIPRATLPDPNEPKFSRISKVLSAMEPGKATYHGMACYTCNPLQDFFHWPVCVRTPDVNFTVLPPVLSPSGRRSGVFLPINPVSVALGEAGEGL